MMTNHTTRRSLLAAAPLAFVPGVRAESRKVRIGIVGGRFGSTFQWHLDPDCSVTAVCDIAEEPLKRLGATYRCGNAYKSYTEMLKHSELDAVGIFTPAPLHVAMALEAFRGASTSSAPSLQASQWRNWSVCWKA